MDGLYEFVNKNSIPPMFKIRNTLYTPKTLRLITSNQHSSNLKFLIENIHLV